MNTPHPKFAGMSRRDRMRLKARKRPQFSSSHRVAQDGDPYNRKVERQQSAQPIKLPTYVAPGGVIAARYVRRVLASRKEGRLVKGMYAYTSGRTQSPRSQRIRQERRERAARKARWADLRQRQAA